MESGRKVLGRLRPQTLGQFLVSLGRLSFFSPPSPFPSSSPLLFLTPQPLSFPFPIPPFSVLAPSTRKISLVRLSMYSLVLPTSLLWSSLPVLKIEHEDVVFLRMGAVQTESVCTALMPASSLSHIHHATGRPDPPPPGVHATGLLHRRRSGWRRGTGITAPGRGRGCGRTAWGCPRASPSPPLCPPPGRRRFRDHASATGARPSVPVRWRMIRVSRPFSLVSV